VTLTGWKGPEAVAELLEKTAVYLSCSAWEGLPYGVLEAMNCGCALLLRNVPGNRDLVVSGENGRLFETKEEAVLLLKEMLADTQGTAEMGKKSRMILEKDFSLKQMGEGYRRIYGQAIFEAKRKNKT
jgi:glycosyltransferase involved in cell wall biosynthesis